MLLHVLSDIPTHRIIHLRIEVLTHVVIDVRFNVLLYASTQSPRGVSP
jgi:hypothetical protein